MKTNDLGDIGVAYATADLIRQGWQVLLPVSSVSPFDLVAYRDGVFRRVQVKYRRTRNGVLILDCARMIVNRVRVERRANKDIDVVCGVCAETNTCYYVPAEGLGTYLLRIGETRNGQRKGVRFAADYREMK